MSRSNYASRGFANPARAARKLRCGSSPAATGPFNARTAISGIADRNLAAARVLAAAADDMPARSDGSIGTVAMRMTVIEGGSSTRCRKCHKAIVWPGLCYACAAGLPRQLRPRVDASTDYPAHPVVATAESSGRG